MWTAVFLSGEAPFLPSLWQSAQLVGVGSMEVSWWQSVQDGLYPCAWASWSHLAAAYPLYQQLGIFVPLIVVNCIILGRAEAFAAKNPVSLSLADGLGIGLGFTLSLVFLGGIRELFGTGMLFGTQVMWQGYQPFGIMVEAPGAFICLGLTLAAMNVINTWQARRKGLEAPENPQSGCAACRACAGIK